MNHTSLDQTLQSLAPIRDLSPEPAAAALARVLLEAANRLQTPAEREQQEELERMMLHPEDKTTLMQITDQAFRTHDNRRSVEQLTELVGRVSLKQLVRETTDLIEKLSIEAALRLTDDNRASAAELLGLSRQSLYVKLRRYGLAEGPPQPGDTD